MTTAADLPSPITTPVPADLDRQPEVSFDPEERLQLPPRSRADALEHCRTLADEDAFLRLLLDEDRGPDVEARGVLPLDELLDAHRHGVRHLLSREEEHLLADDLRDPEGLGLVAGRVLGEEGRVLRQDPHDQRQQPVAVDALSGGDGDELAERMRAPPRLEDRQHPPLRPHEVGLVQHTEDRSSVGLERLQHEPVRMDALRGVHDEANEVDLLDRAARGLLHEGTEPTGGRVEPWRVDEDNLRAREVLDAGDPVARRLRARRDDGELLAHEAIQEGRLARVRAADERNEPCAGHCSGVREARAIGGWPETRRDPAALRMARLIPDQLREARAIGGWPETRRDPAALRMARLIPDQLREARAIGGWPETRRDPAALRMARLIPDQLREARATGGWPETRRDPAALRMALFIPAGPSRAAGAPGGGPTRGSAARARA